MEAEALQAKIKICMFDQYGTVLDMQTGLTEVVTPWLRDGENKWGRNHFSGSAGRGRHPSRAVGR